MNIEREERNEIQQETQEETREEICPVCLDPHQPSDFLSQYRCSHIICRSCYSECINHQRYTCSLCRAPNILQHYILTQI